MTSAAVGQWRQPQGTPQGAHCPSRQRNWATCNVLFTGLAITTRGFVADERERDEARREDQEDSGPMAKRQRSEEPVEDQETSPMDSQRHSYMHKQKHSYMDNLPDEILSLVLGIAIEQCDTPGDVMNMLLTSKRICQLGSQSSLLRRLPLRALQVAVRSWSEPAQRFLVRCCQAGNAHACFALGMIEFYCTSRPTLGLRLLAQGAILNNPECLYSLAVIHFNGSSGGKKNRDPSAGALLCMRAAELGHVAAMRELGHCLQDGYGVHRDPPRGMQLLVKANTLETNASRAAQGTCNNPRRAQDAREGAGECQQHCPPSDPKCRDVESASALQGNSERVNPRETGNVPVTGKDEQSGSWLMRNGCLERVAQVSGSDMALKPSRGQPNGGLVEELNGGNEVAQGRRNTPTRCETQHCCCLPSSVPTLQTSPDGWVRKFLVDWHALTEFEQMMSLANRSMGETGIHNGVPWNNLMQCSNKFCGRRELRTDEFRCCSACMEARYCSRVCQALDWKLGHKILCPQLAQLRNGNELNFDF